ncbi:UDP-2,4-diacetamido-2,4,6-trideoxy-beta-L-altropyranose hydrolase [Paenibacillus aquistagni]|uniref:UDP-2,4-diacetamido-2,4, 6-trideoxy-beta-L-altropyranose hydrolase n=1 Tax=Paenibacillus aquistagni TaxID=1852522 RepID=UPI000B4FD57E|nr:UDP-2,4-diacetamido-2,4,6-trideoxy-beta-L-altropyranose hydrolase [Paenibacillus aquistagni]
MKTIVFRADASPQIGSGHVMRCLVLAEQFIQQGCRVIFICNQLPQVLYDKLISLSIDVIDLSCLGPIETNPLEQEHRTQDRDAILTIEALDQIGERPYALIVDHYERDEKWELVIKLHVDILVVIDDLANRKHDCDILLDQNYVINMSTRYKKLVPSTCQLFLGPSFALLRDDFIQQSYHVRKGVRRALITFGGSDPTGETMKLLHLIELGRLPKWEYDIVVGGLYTNKKEIRERCQFISNVNYYENVQNMSERMILADICIGSSGISQWERSTLGLPTILIVVANNQSDSAYALEKDRLAWNLGWHEDVQEEQLVELLWELDRNPQQIEYMSKRIISMMNGCESKSDSEVIHPLVRAVMGG